MMNETSIKFSKVNQHIWDVEAPIVYETEQNRECYFEGNALSQSKHIGLVLNPEKKPLNIAESCKVHSYQRH